MNLPVRVLDPHARLGRVIGAVGNATMTRRGGREVQQELNRLKVPRSALALRGRIISSD